jgi:Glycosyl transferase family 2
MTALTIGLATYDDFDGVYFTLQALRLYHDLTDTELLVIDNFGCATTRDFVERWTGGRYVLDTTVTGSAAPRDRVFAEARGKAVVCCDCHVLFAPGTIVRLRAYHRAHPDSSDLLQGPLLYDDARRISTHFEPRWDGHMWGAFATDPRGLDPEDDAFEIPMQGLGVFSCRRDAWLGFHPEFRGHGGEEGYIHEKFWRANRKCLCLPWLRWMHRFPRPAGTKFPVDVRDRVRNYIIGHAELGLDLGHVVDHFAKHLPRSEVVAIAETALHVKWTRT